MPGIYAYDMKRGIRWSNDVSSAGALYYEMVRSDARQHQEMLVVQSSDK